MNEPDARLIEVDEFPFEFLSQIAERESWRKEIHRPIYHVHKWWAKRLGSVFRGILLASAVKDSVDLPKAFYGVHSFSNVTVFDPFMGSGTTIGEAHKLGFTSLGRDINSVAVQAVRAALGPMNIKRLNDAYHLVAADVEGRIKELYHCTDSTGNDSDVLYYFMVMQALCPHCDKPVDLFSSYIFAQNAYPKRKPEVQVVCPSCSGVFEGIHGATKAACPKCSLAFNPQNGPARGQTAICSHCTGSFSILQAIAKHAHRPSYRLYAKLILRQDGQKEYLAINDEDRFLYKRCSQLLESQLAQGAIVLPDLALEGGYNTSQAMSYHFTNWRDFFSDRQLLALGWLRASIDKLEDPATRVLMLILFSGLLEFNNLFTSYKGEGTGAVRHMFSHHILKPERTPIEANVWGTSKSSGSFSGLFKGRLLRALGYRQRPTEVNGTETGKGLVCSPPFTGKVAAWPASEGPLSTRGIYLSCGDSACTGLGGQSIDLVVTDPPFFDNVHYSQLADFFHAWQQIGGSTGSTRHQAEVQDTDVDNFSKKLCNVFSECHRVLKDDGLLVFTYHHSREDGWYALAKSIHEANFTIVNSHPIKGEMSVGVPKLGAKEPIQLDIILVCRKARIGWDRPSVAEALRVARNKLERLASVGFTLSRNDKKIVLFGQLLTTIRDSDDAGRLGVIVNDELVKLSNAMPEQRAS